MPQKLQAYQVQLDCPSCDAKILASAPISSNPRGFKKGNIVVCAHCHSICKVGDSNLVLMKKKELKALDPVSKRVLNITINKLRRTPLPGDVEDN